MAKAFGKKIQFETFSNEQLEDARNKIRTQISQTKSNSGFNENLESDAFHQAQWMLDAINAEIAERNEHIIEADEDVEEGKMKDLHQDVEEYLVRMSDVLTDQERYDLSHEFHELAYKLDDIGIGGVMKEINRRANETGSKWWKGVSKEFSKKFGKFAEGFDGDVEGEEDVPPEVEAAIEKFLATNPKNGDDLQAFHQKAIMDKNKKLDDYLTFLYDYVADQTGAGGTEELGVYDEMLDTLTQMMADKGWSEGVDEDHGPEDPDADYNQGEYDREGDMAKDQLRTVNDAAKELYSIIHADENLPEWVQSKITKAMDYLDTARDYMKSNKYAENIESHGNVVAEGEVQQASAIVTAKTMVDRVGRWIDELSGMENETLLQLGDSIRDEMGAEQSRAFIEATSPAIEQALENLKTTRETLASAMRQLTGEEASTDMLGAEPEVDVDAEPAVEPAPADEMNAEPADEFAASEPAAGGEEVPGREQRESIDRTSKYLRLLAG